MKFNKFALTVSALAAGVVLSACNHSAPGASNAKAPDSTVSAETEMSKLGCSFTDGAALPTSGSEKQKDLTCNTAKSTGQQIAAVTKYMSKISAAMKEPGRKDIGQLQVKLNSANTKLAALVQSFKDAQQASAE